MRHRPTTKRLWMATGTGATLLGALVLTGCGSNAEPNRAAAQETVTASPLPPSPSSPSSPRSPSSPAEPSVPSAPAGAVTLEVRVEGDTITPKQQGIDVKPNQALVLLIDSNRSGELHVHSSPEKEIAFDAGTSTITLRFAQPGVVEIEEHDADVLIAQVTVQ